MRPRLLRRVLTPIFLTLALFAVGVDTASATHFLGGKLTWKRDLNHPPPNIKIDITFEASWRASFGWTPNPPILNQVFQPFYDITLVTAQGQSQVYQLAQTAVVTNYAEDWITGRYTFSVIFAPSQFPVTATHNNCCRSSVLEEGNNDKEWRLTTVIDITKGTRSPESTMLPRIYLEQGVASTFQIPTVAYDGLTNMVSIAPLTDSGLVSGRPVGISFCAPTPGDPVPCDICQNEPLFGNCANALRVTSAGFVTWTPQVAGLYAVQFKVTSVDATHVWKNSMPLDLLITVREPCPQCAKVFVSVPQQLYNVVAGFPLSFNVTATGTNLPVTNILTLTNTPLPPNATLTTLSNPPVSPMVTAFHWTPTPANVGDHFMCFQAIATPANIASFGQSCVTVRVLPNQAPVAQCVAPPAATAANPLGAIVPLQAALVDPELQALNWSFSVNNVNLPGGTGALPAGNGVLVPVNASANFPIGTTLVTFKASDAFQTASCTINVTVNRVPQQITFAPATPVSLGIAPFPLTATSTSLLPVQLQLLSGPGILIGNTLTVGAVGAIEVKATQAGDAIYAPADPVNAFITVVDTTAPVIGGHGMEVAEATGPSGTAVSYQSPGFTDNVDAPGTANCLPASGAMFAVGDNLVTCSTADTAGNSASSTFTVRITDTTAPAIVAAVSISTAATSPAGAAVTYVSPSASDLVDGAVAVSCNPPSTSTFPLGATTVTCTATDAHSNSSSTTFTVTVTNNAPSVAVSNVVAEATSPLGAAVAFTATAGDVEDGAITPSCVPAANSVFAIGTTPVTCTATDAAGESASGTFTVTVRDTTAPVVTYSNNAGTYSIGQTVNITCAATDAVGVASSTCANISGPAYSFAVGANTFSASATDAAGNTGGASATFTVVSSLQGIQQLVNSFCTNPGICSGLNAKLSAAASANNANARAGQLGAFENQLQAQVGKCLTAEQAAILQQLVQGFY